MQSLSRTTWSRKALPMVFDTARPKYKENMAWNAWKRCCKKVDSQGGHFSGIHDRFLRDPVHRDSQLAIGWSEQKCKEWDELAKEDHTYKLTPQEKRSHKGQWYLTLNKAGKNGPSKLRSDYRAAVMMENRLHHESGEPIEELIHPRQQRRIQQGQEVFSEDYFSSTRVDQHTGWAYLPSSTSSSWWYASAWSWKWAHKICSLLRSLFLLQLISFTVDRDPLWPTGCVDRTHSHETFSRHFHPCAHITLWLKVSHDVSAKNIFIHMSSPVWAFVVSLFCLLPLSLVPLRSLSLLLVLCPELQLPWCRERRALNPMRTRKMRSIAPWRYTTLSQVLSPTSSTTSSTTSTTQTLLQRPSRMNPST